MTVISELFSDFDRVISGEIDVVCQKPVLILAITARTGSTQLCSILESMKIFGSPDEILNTRGVVQKYISRDGVKSFREYIARLTSDDTPCFAFKTAWCDFLPLTKSYKRIFPDAKFVFLDRFDVVAQAFSICKALETGVWHVQVDSSTEISELSNSKISEACVQSFMRKLVYEKYQWERFFFENQLLVRHFYYEIIKEDWNTAARLIGEQFGFYDNIITGEGKFIRLSGDSDEQLIAKFKNDHGYSWISVY